jgi:non-specific serine/threonine protein kinase/serine/threonine-protein kinase
MNEDPADPASASAPTEGGATRTDASAGTAAESIGPYRLLQRIGEGGMGEVWLAEQSEPIRRRVALKLIKAGMDTKQVVARFEAERQALALMDHPSIAKVFDAGETPRGLPYFVMEYVKGEAISVYCDRQRLTTNERLQLFLAVCEGVQHAHQKGIIHRDLKPSNVLVANLGDKPVPKIIDFGVAKATAQRLTERTMFTELGAMIGTPEYMSPEQAEMSGLDVDTRTDVYALGVILYELLTGALPFDSKELRQQGFSEIQRRIREVEPPRPSARVSTLGDKATESARMRRTEPTRLAGHLKGDLDWITMKALEKDRTRRYGSPSELAADIGRHLDHQPVLAGPPSATYRVGKFVRRHRIGVTVAALIVVALAGFGVTMAVQARRIAKERNRAERVSEFLADLFRVSDPDQARGNALTAREILDKGADRIEKELAAEPEVQGQLFRTIGRVYRNLGLYAKAEPLLARSVEIRRRVLGADHPDTLQSMDSLAVFYEQAGRYDEAEKLQAETVAGRRRVLGENHPLTLESKDELGAVYESQGRYPESEKLWNDVLTARRRALGSDDLALLGSLGNVASAKQNRGRYDEAEKLYLEEIAGRTRVQGEDHPSTLWAMNNLGNVYQLQHHYDRAEAMHLKTLELRRRVLGNDHPRTLASMGNLSDVYFAEGRMEEAEKLARETLEANRRVVGPEHRNTMLGMDSLAKVWFALGRKGEAERLYQETVASQSRVLGPEHPDTLSTMDDLAAIYVSEARYDEADQLFEAALKGMRRVLGESHPDAAIPLSGLAHVAALRGERAKAIDWLRQAVEHGYRPSGGLANDPDLKSLHGDPGFETLAAK